MKIPNVLSDFQNKKKERERKAYNEFLMLKEVPGASKTAIMERLAKKHRIGTSRTFYRMVKRMELENSKSVES